MYENDARDSLTLYFRNLAYAVVDEDGENVDETISSKKTETENAMSILRYFRHCGWISNRELGRNGDNIATVNPYCRKLIDGIERVFNRDNSAALTNHIFAIFDILSSAFNEDHARNIRPYSSMWKEGERMSDLQELTNELMQVPEFESEYERLQPEMDITRAILDARIHAGVTQLELSEKSGIS